MCWNKRGHLKLTLVTRHSLINCHVLLIISSGNNQGYSIVYRGTRDRNKLSASEKVWAISLSKTHRKSLFRKAHSTLSPTCPGRKMTTFSAGWCTFTGPALLPRNCFSRSCRTAKLLVNPVFLSPHGSTI